MVSKPDLRVANGYITGVSQRAGRSGVVCTEALGHLSPRLLEAHWSVVRPPEQCYRTTFVLNPIKTNVFICLSACHSFMFQNI